VREFAELAADASLDASDDFGSGFSRIVAIAQRAANAAHWGDADQARQDARDVVMLTEPGDFRFTARWLAEELASMELAHGDRKAAATWLAPLLEGGTVAPNYRFALPTLIEALAETSSPELVTDWLRIFSIGAPELGRLRHEALLRRSTAVQLSAIGRFDEAAAAAKRAADLLRDSEFRVQYGRSELLLGQLERRRRKRGSARRALSEAVEVFVATGAVHWERRAAAELKRTWAPSPRSQSDELSPSERRVAALAAQGFTNREIGSQLYISPKTVEATLTSVYRKLGIRRRAGLSAALGAVTSEGLSTPGPDR
jgi:DNA-binding CsgD family transcriptional regulator